MYGHDLNRAEHDVLPGLYQANIWPQVSAQSNSRLPLLMHKGNSVRIRSRPVISLSVTFKKKAV